MPAPRQHVEFVSPKELQQNPENPRLIFRENDLQTLFESISLQGILVPLTVFRKSARTLVLLDGERRWRCAIKLGLSRVPVIIQPEPARLQNIMMMFAIHNARRDWDPLPTAYKLRELEDEFEKTQGRKPKEAELAEIASITRGEVRRLKKLLNLPSEYQTELLSELEKPRSEQAITVDQVLEASAGAAALRKKLIVDETEEEEVRRAVINKFRSGVLINTVSPRKLARIARAVDRDEVTVAIARQAIRRFVTDKNYTIDEAFNDSAARAELEHGLQIQVVRLIDNLSEFKNAKHAMGNELREKLLELDRIIRALVRRD